MPAILTAFSMDEWVFCGTVHRVASCSPESPIALTAKPERTSRAVRIAHSVEVEAVSWITPVKLPGSPIISRSQSITRSSSSVAAGDVTQLMHCAAERGGQHFGEHGRRTAVGGEIGEERRVLPVGHSREDDLVEIPEDPVEGFPIGGRMFGELAGTPPGAAPARGRATFRRSGSSPRSSRPVRGRGGGRSRYPPLDLRLPRVLCVRGQPLVHAGIDAFRG